MKISAIQNNKLIKNLIVATPLLLLPSATLPISSQQPIKDTFEKTTTQTQRIIPVHETKDVSPAIKVGKETVYPAVVVDKSENKLYFYDLGGYIDTILDVGLGKASTPTDTGLRIITGIEEFPYSKAPEKTLRHQSPEEYGSNVICLATVDTETGKITGTNGEFIHGTNKPNSIGKNQSKGCIRLHNEDVEKLASWLFVGQYVLIKD